jgi:dihydroorotate dehydrogenase
MNIGMTVYPILRRLLFLFPAEFTHRLTLATLRLAVALPLLPTLIRRIYARRVPALPVTLMGLTLRNPVGLAAGLDKDAECAGAFADFGFSFVELGTVTPRAQPGNLRPRLFRLVRPAAIVNRMGFNNAGVEAFLRHLRARPVRAVVGINIGRNKDTPNERALDDYVGALRAVYADAAYITVNISSPNTPGLRALQESGQLEALLTALKTEQARLEKQHGRYVPIALKIAPDLDDEQIAEIARLLRVHRLDAVVATNTTVTRPGLSDEPFANESGGLSGRPLRPLATAVIRKLYGHLQGAVPIIGVGGIETADDAWEKLVAGAAAVQVYTAFIYRGPRLVREIVTGLQARVAASGAATLAEALERARQKPDT